MRGAMAGYIFAEIQTCSTQLSLGTTILSAAVHRQRFETHVASVQRCEP
ncbi:unnamed protein product [Chondrus crispus]|uniref:Uncharacterized protein n=1 Tax=Chondrus crispus TaxID=2769 RepID=R7QU68_CHOCR|nr:unnamed protein product [Chondrus crispus]CDF41248.1 unnamed protein product [Chondrus crispus]|eukprot:XP_005711542.1 unnamed protein product [Chondrus crispus]